MNAKSMKVNIKTRNKMGRLSSLREKLDRFDKELTKKIKEKKESNSKAKNILGDIIFVISIAYFIVFVVKIILLILI